MSASNGLMRVRRHWLPKRGNSSEEYEDASACSLDHRRIAIADGATESSFAGLWARLLVDGFCGQRDSLPTAWAAWLPPLQQRWASEAGARPLPWFAENQFQLGAFATFLGVVLDAPTGNSSRWTWQATAVGDACLFHQTPKGLQQAFPVTRSEDFGNTPWLIGSRGLPALVAAEREVHAWGELSRGDRLWLMTDALAQWFLLEREEGRSPHESLEAVLNAASPDDAFAGFANAARDAGALRNDDVTLVAVDLR
jgi:hypothetical protein